MIGNNRTFQKTASENSSRYIQQGRDPGSHLLYRRPARGRCACPHHEWR